MWNPNCFYSPPCWIFRAWGICGKSWFCALCSYCHLKELCYLKHSCSDLFVRLHVGEGRPLKYLIAKVGKWVVRIIYCILVMWERDLSSALGSLVLKKLKFLFVLLLQKKIQLLEIILGNMQERHSKIVNLLDGKDRGDTAFIFPPDTPLLLTNRSLHKHPVPIGLMNNCAEAPQLLFGIGCGIGIFSQSCPGFSWDSRRASLASLPL